MADDLDTYRMAKSLIKLHPEDALARAERRAIRSNSQDVELGQRWRQIVAAIKELQATQA
jgi:hypothetical protein